MFFGADKNSEVESEGSGFVPSGVKIDMEKETEFKKQLNMMNFTRVYVALSKVAEKWSKG